MSSAACLGLAVATLFASQPQPRQKPVRAAYAGFAGAGLTPKHERSLEALLLEGLDDYESFRLVDAGGEPLDPRLLASEAERVERLRREGIELFLSFKPKQARQKLEHAVEVFETQLTSLPNHELLHAVLLALAEAELQGGDETAARTTLGRWIALGPHSAPKTEDHSKRFVRLYRQASRRKGPTGGLSLRCIPANCTLRLDGKVLGGNPQHITKMRAGKHYVVARWPHALERRVVHVARGRNTEIEISLEGPSEAARRELLKATRERLGIPAAKAAAAKVAGLARAERVILASTLPETDGRSVVLSVHDAEGDLMHIVKTPLPEVGSKDAGQRLARMGVALFVDNRHEPIALDKDGSVYAAPGLGTRVYEGVRGGAAAPTTPLAPQLPPPALVSEPDLSAPDDGSTPLWIWLVAGGVAAIATGVTLGVLLSGGEATSTQFEVILP